MSNIKNAVVKSKDKFMGILPDEKIYRKEANFAMQILQSNGFATGVACKNPQSLIDAITNIASLGVTLNPAEKKAYLVPRGGKICLDISYMGLIDLAVRDGAIVFAQAQIVRATDGFRLNNFGEAPSHDFDCFASDNERGEIVGAYCVAKINSTDFIVETINVDDIKRAKKASTTDNVWKSFYGEMVRKTVVKRASKYWKGSAKLANAIEHLNIENGEGFARVGAIEQNTEIKSMDTLLVSDNDGVQDRQVNADTKTEQSPFDILENLTAKMLPEDKKSFEKYYNITKDSEEIVKTIVENFDDCLENWKEIFGADNGTL